MSRTSKNDPGISDRAGFVGKKVTSVEEALNNLGNSYSTDIEQLSSYYKTYTFIDRTNNLEVNVADIYKDKSEPLIIIQRIDTHYYNKYISAKLKPSGSLGYDWALFEIAFFPFTLGNSSIYISLPSLIFMPIVYFIIFIPTMLAIITKKYRRACIMTQLLVIFIIFFGVFEVISHQ